MITVDRCSRLARSFSVLSLVVAGACISDATPGEEPAPADESSPRDPGGALARPPSPSLTVDPCGIHGELVIGPAAHTCVCDPYWTGPACDQPTGCSGHGSGGVAAPCTCEPYWAGPQCERCFAIGGCELHLSTRFPQAVRQAAFEEGAGVLSGAVQVTSPELAAIAVQSLLGTAWAARTVVIGTPTAVRVDEVTTDGELFPQTTMAVSVDSTLKSSTTIGASLNFAFTGDRLHIVSGQHIPAAIGRKGLFALDTRCGLTCYHRLFTDDGYADVDDDGIVLPGAIIEPTDLQAAIAALP